MIPRGVGTPACRVDIRVDAFPPVRAPRYFFATGRFTTLPLKIVRSTALAIAS
jgi:hypothetical protein